MLDEVQQTACDQFEKQSDRYGKSHILANTDDVAKGLDGLIFPPGGQALDVATGGGHTALFLAGLGLRVTAADISAAMLEHVKKLAAEKGFSISTSRHAAEKFPYPDASFDLVTCRVAAHHFNNRDAFLEETRRVLKPGGYFLLIDGSVPEAGPVAAAWIHQVEKFRDPSHGRFLSPSEWSDLCRKHGLACCAARRRLSSSRIWNGIFKPPLLRRKTSKRCANWCRMRRSRPEEFSVSRRKRARRSGGGPA